MTKIKRGQVWLHNNNKKQYKIVRLIGYQLFGKWFFIVLYCERYNSNTWFVRTSKNFLNSFTKELL